MYTERSCMWHDGLDGIKPGGVEERRSGGKRGGRLCSRQEQG
jgi:hypothetical protein